MQQLLACLFRINIEFIDEKINKINLKLKILFEFRWRKSKKKKVTKIHKTKLNIILPTAKWIFILFGKKRNLFAQ